MCVMLYISKFERHMDRFIRKIVSFIPEERLETYTDIQFFKERLEQAENKPRLLILCLEDKKELRQLQNFKKLYDDIPVFLFLADEIGGLNNMRDLPEINYVYPMNNCFADPPASCRRFLSDLSNVDSGLAV